MGVTSHEALNGDSRSGLVVTTTENAVSATRLKWYCAVLVLLEVVLVPPRHWPVTVLMVVVTAGAGAGIFLFYARPRLEIGTKGLTVVNPVSTTFIPFEDITRYEGGAFLTITTTQGARVTVWAVQGRNWERVRGRPTFADEIAKLVAEKASQRSGTPFDPAQFEQSRRSEKVRALLLPMIVGLIFILRDVVLR